MKQTKATIIIFACLVFLTVHSALAAEGVAKIEKTPSAPESLLTIDDIQPIAASVAKAKMPTTNPVQSAPSSATP